VCDGDVVELKEYGESTALLIKVVDVELTPETRLETVNDRLAVELNVGQGSSIVLILYLAIAEVVGVVKVPALTDGCSSVTL
jgi:hypothetical protein